MSDVRLKIINDLLKIRGRVFDLDGEGAAFGQITEAVQALRVVGETEAEPELPLRGMPV